MMLGGRENSHNFLLFKCKFCSGLYDTAQSLIAHKRRDHVDEIAEVVRSSVSGAGSQKLEAHYGDGYGSNYYEESQQSESSSMTDDDEEQGDRRKLNQSDLDDPTLPDEYDDEQLKESDLNDLEEPDENYNDGLNLSDLHDPEGQNDHEDEQLNLSDLDDLEEPSSFRCRFCRVKMQTVDELRNHERFHTGEKPFQCQHCLKGFSERWEVEEHEGECPVVEMLRNEKKPPIQKKVNRRFFKGSTFHPINGKAAKAKELKMKYGISKAFTCKSCPKSFDQLPNLRRHESLFHYPKSKSIFSSSLTCDTCSQCFATEAKLAWHQKVSKKCQVLGITVLRSEPVEFLPNLLKCFGEDGQVLYACQLCDKKMLSRATGLSHMSVHFGSKIFSCSSCDLKFVNSVQVRKHLAADHNKGTTVGTGSRSAVWHEDTDYHFNEETIDGSVVFNCKLCKKSITAKGGSRGVSIHRMYMRHHIRRKHTRTNLFSCSKCDRGFVFPKLLQDHECDKPKRSRNALFKCVLCPLIFPNQELFLKHKEGHGSRLPLMCLKCGLWFRYDVEFKKHYAKYHGD